MEDDQQVGDEGSFVSVKCHERPITEVRFNRDGDLIFTAGKDSCATLLRTDGAAVGEYRRHEGSIFSIAVDRESSCLVTGSADQSIVLWDVCTGGVRTHVSTNCVVKGLDFFEDGRQCVTCNDDSMNKIPSIGIFDLRTRGVEKVFTPTSTPTRVLLDSSERFVVYSDSDGYVSKVDIRNSKGVQNTKVHSSKINNIRPSRCRSFFVTASSDSQSKIVDFADLSVQKTFSCEEPVNCAVVFNTNDKAACVGGINARDVTTTKGKSSFDASFFDVVTEEKIGSYSTHFGTINAVDVHPGGRMYCSGGEEGTLSILQFGQDFFKARFTRLD